jgi:hypothetical protein
MSATFDITTLTFNQWLLAGVIILATLLLLFWVLSLLLSSGFRREVMTFDESFNRLPDGEQDSLKYMELHAIWVGRIRELRDRFTGRGTTRIRWIHLVSVLVWILVFCCIAGYFSTISTPDFWGLCIFAIVGMTYIYAEWKSLLKPG